MKNKMLILLVMFISLLTSCNTVKYSYTTYDINEYNYNTGTYDNITTEASKNGIIKISNDKTKLIIKDSDKPKSVLTILKYRKNKFGKFKDDIYITAFDGETTVNFRLLYNINIILIGICPDENGNYQGLVYYEPINKIK